MRCVGPDGSQGDRDATGPRRMNATAIADEQFTAKPTPGKYQVKQSKQLFVHCGPKKSGSAFDIIPLEKHARFL